MEIQTINIQFHRRARTASPSPRGQARYTATTKLRWIPVGFALTLVLSACGGGSSSDSNSPSNDDPQASSAFDPATNDSCESDVQNQWVYNNMLDYYLFYDQVPSVNPQSFASPEDLLRAVRFEERDPYSFLTDSSSSTLQFEEGREYGLGYRWGLDDNGNPRLTRVVDDSPFGRAGLERGDIIVSINGIPWNEYSAELFQNNVFGSPDAPVTSTWEVIKRDSGENIQVSITGAEYSINTVLHKQYFTNAAYSGSIGYLAFSRFLQTSGAELQSAFQEFNDNNISDLILDLRYNSGGRVVVAEYLASLIAGSSRANQPLYEYRFNHKYTDYNYSLELLNNVGELGLSRIIILTRSGTASASEIVIAGLQPYLEVVTMGTRTSGKPYIQYGRSRCGKQLNAVEAEGFNAAGVSVYGGIAPTCHATDDRTSDFGIHPDTGRLEGMLESALDYVVFGDCDTNFPQAKQASNSADGHVNPFESDEKQGLIDIGGAIR